MDEAKISDIYKYSCLRAKNRHLFLEQPPRARMENSVEAAFLEKHYVSIHQP